MRIVLIALLCFCVTTGCKKKHDHICRCDDGTSVGEVHKLDKDLSYDQRQSACKQFQTLDSTGQVTKACKIFVPI